MEAEWRNALPVGAEIDACRIERVLGAGGFGITYLATDLRLDRKVAVKEYLPTSLAERAPDGRTVRSINSASEETFQFGLDRFQAEAQTLARFSHPNIVGVQRFFADHGTAYIVMPYEDGLSLADILVRHGALTEEELREILDPLLDGLAKVHEAGFLHRDIKPGNIYVRRSDGSPVLLDFGAARQALSERSQSLTIIATPGYAPFEQYSSRGNQGPWTDIYALGATVYRAITGVMPPDALSRLQGEELPPATRSAMGPYSRTFLEAVDAALALQPADRPQSIEAWRAQLWERTGPVSGTSAGTIALGATPAASSARAGARPTRPGPPPRRRRIGRVVWLSAIVLLAAIGAAAAVVRPWEAGGPLGADPSAADPLAADRALKRAYADKKKAEDEAARRAKAAEELQRQLEAERRKREEDRRRAEEEKRRAEEERRKAEEEERKAAEKREKEKREQEKRQQAELTPPKQSEPRTPGSVFRDCSDCPRMVVLPAGSFVMGSPGHVAGRYPDEGPQQAVTIRSFAMGKREVTVGQFARFMAATAHTVSACYVWRNGDWVANTDQNWRSPGFAQDDRHPVTCVSWLDATAYAQWLARTTGKRYRLPSEAEWEYAARGGTSTVRYWGDDEGRACVFANVADLSARAENPSWNVQACNDRHAQTAPVGSYRSNPFGLDDMLGNVIEWVQDCWNDTYRGRPTDNAAWLAGQCQFRVRRGGAWDRRAQFIRSAYRNKARPTEAANSAGFRVVRELAAAVTQGNPSTPAPQTRDRAAGTSPTPCDYLAGEPFDKDKVTPGVLFHKLDVDAATRACATALRADPDNPRLLMLTGRVALARKDHAAAVEAFRKSAAGGYATGITWLGWLHYIGAGVPKDYARALALFRRAAARGDITAPNNIGWMHFLGVHVGRDYNEARRLFARSARRGYNYAQYNLHLLYRDGKGVPRDMAQAYYWLALAIENGLDQARFKRELTKIGQMLTAGQRQALDGQVQRWKPARN